MKCAHRRLLLAFLLAAAVLMPPLFAAEPPVEGPDAGQELAQRLRAAEPEENSRISGTLIIRAGAKTKNVPVLCRVAVNGAAWETVYETAATTNGPAERLTVLHSTNGPNQYLYSRAGAPAVPVPASEAADIPLAGSDFSLADLALEFLHWPEQQRFRDETRLSQACYVLESRNPSGRGITRVKCYIDKDSGGLLVAEAYDAGSHEIKEFSLHGTSFKKVRGHWQLEKMEIRDKKKHSQTELKFDTGKE